ncbi:hypothetical protein KJ855_01180, partial [Patescibacteria group bacterium]|nr:hypothetical protein [Patescibacteria group bacterium]
MKPKLKKSKSNPKSATQKHLPFHEIRDGLIIMKDGSLRSVLYTSAINFDLKSNQEQNAIIYQYQNFLNSLPFPIQIIIQSKKLDLSEYIAKLKDLETKQVNDLLRLQMSEYISFIQRLMKVTNIMEKKFYVVITYYPPDVATRTIWQKIFPPKEDFIVKETDFSKAKEKISERINLVSNGLASMGLRAVSLTTQEVAELMYVH